MSIPVSEMAVYNNYDPIPVGTEVELITKEFVKLNTKTFGSEVKDVDADKFKKAILLERKQIPYRGGKNNIMQGGHGSTMEYTVRFNTNEEETFRTDPRKYYFKMLNKPVTGGKRRLQKTKKNKKYKKRKTRKH